MRDAASDRPAARRRLAQALEQPVGRAPQMQYHRQAVALRQPQLLAVALPLALAHPGRAEFGQEEVEPDLADRDQARVAGMALERSGQRLQVLGTGARHEQRVDAERIGVAGPVCQFAHGSEIGRVHRRIDAQADAQRARLLARLQAQGMVGAELGRIEVAMGIDPHAGIVLHPW